MTGSKCQKRCMALIAALVIGFLPAGCGDSPVDGGNAPGELEGEFLLFTTDTGLVGNWVTDILVDYTRGGVWFATISGISFHCTQEDTWISFGAASALPSLEVTSLTADASTIWAGTASGAAYTSDNTWVGTGDADSLASRYVTSVASIGGDVWIGTRGGVGIHSADGVHALTDPIGLLNSGVTDIVASGTDVWIGTPGGIAVNDGDDWRYYGASELPSTVVHALFRSHDGSMWVGTAGGIAVFDGSSWWHYTAADGLPAAGVNGFAETRGHEIWAATDANPAYLADGRFVAVPLPGAALGAVVTSIAADMMTDDLWFGTMIGAVGYRR